MHKLARLLSNLGKVNLYGLVHSLRYIRYNKNLVLKYYTNIKYAPLSDLLRQANIKTKNQLMDFSDSSCQYCPDTCRSTGAYIIFYQVEPIDHGTHVPGPVDSFSAEIEYNSACTTVIALAHIRMLVHELLNKDPDIVPEKAQLIILDIKSSMCMAKNGKDVNHTRHISRRVHLVLNGDKCKMHRIDWYVGGLKLA